ncbi:MAG TPA: Zn-dependent alcohol dehydrogenase [Ktedonosporobacter sp.]|nr:Zn-dependent alcohol dehydrogenase [Ktedonosporobacter sp.]
MESIICQAAICYTFREPLRVEEVILDAPKEEEVRVRMAAVAICHSDLHYMRGEWNAELPAVFGHEAAGIVEKVGERVSLVHPGQRVAISLIRSCGHCFYCMQGASQRCEGTFALQRESRLHSPEGQPIYQGVRIGAFADYVVVHQSQLVPLPDTIPLEYAALLSCGVVTGVGAVVHTAQVRPGSTIVVIGAGGVGLNIIQGALLAGASQIIALDRLSFKLLEARKFGATHAFLAEDNVLSSVRNLTSGRGADYVFVAVGNAQAMKEGLELLRPRGTLIVVGQPPMEDRAGIPVREIAISEKIIMGSLMGSTRLHQDIPWLISLYQQGRLKLKELISRRYPLSRVNEAIEEMEAGHSLRNLIVWQEQ